MQTEIIKDLMKEYKRPFYIYDEKVIGDQIQELKTNFPEFEFLYSIKTNPNKDVIKFIAQNDIGSDSASKNEVFKSIDAGMPKEKIIYSSAGKTKQDIEETYDKCIITADSYHELEVINEVAKEHNIEFEERHGKGEIINLFFEEFCENNLIQPTFVMDHPIAISPLTKKKPEDPTKVERFELFINTWEMCNAYSELNDPIDQRERFKLQDAAADAGDEEANHTDEDFLYALEVGMPPTGGIGYGIDRLCMLLTDSQAIRDVLLFPTMKQLDK